MLSPEDERRLVASAEGDLHRAFPDVPIEEIHHLVTGIWGDLVSARIREFVPVLVLAATRDQLRVRRVTSA